MRIFLSVRGLGLEGTQFTWEADPAHDDVLSLIQFFVEAGEGATARGPWYEVNREPIVNAFGYVSKKAFQHSVSERTNYRIRAVNIAKGGETSFSDVVSCEENEGSKVLRHIANQQREFLRLYGLKCLHYPKMHFGPRCECFDRDIGKRITCSCAKCFNTGFSGGYYYPGVMHIASSVLNKSGEPSQFGVQENQMFDSWTSNEAVVEVGDLLVMSTRPSERYVVKRVQATSPGGTTSRQSLSMQKVGMDAPEMMVPSAEPTDVEKNNVFRRYWGQR